MLFVMLMLFILGLLAGCVGSSVPHNPMRGHSRKAPLSIYKTPSSTVAPVVTLGSVKKKEQKKLDRLYGPI